MNQKTYQNVDQNHKICKRKQRQGKQPTKQESERARAHSVKFALCLVMTVNNFVANEYFT